MPGSASLSSYIHSYLPHLILCALSIPMCFMYMHGDFPVFSGVGGWGGYIHGAVLPLGIFVCHFPATGK